MAKKALKRQQRVMHDVFANRAGASDGTLPFKLGSAELEAPQHDDREGVSQVVRAYCGRHGRDLAPELVHPFISFLEVLMPSAL